MSIYLRCSMKKFFIFLIFVTLSLEGFSKTNDDYAIFLTGKEAYYRKDFTRAKQNFETLLRSFSKSDIFSNNYPYFYIGMNYYNLGEYEKAAYFLEKAVYSSQIFLSNNSQAEIAHFFAERDYALGDSLLKIGDIEKGKTYLQRVDYDTFYPFVSYYERKALELLSEYSMEAEKKLKLKFEYDFSLIDDFYTSDLLKIGSFYHSKKEYVKEAELYDKLLQRKYIFIEEKQDIMLAYFELLLETNDIKKILDFTSEPPSELKEMYSYYRGLAFYQSKDFSRALYLFSTIKGSEYFSKANYYISSIYFALGDYEATLETLKNIQDKNVITDFMAAFSYYSLGDIKNLQRAAKAISEKYPNTYIGLYFKTLDINSPKVSLNSLSNLLNFSMKILENFEPLPDNFLQTGDVIEIEQISKISKLKDRDLLRIALEKSIFWEKPTPQAALAVTTILENGEFYDLAFRNSQDNLGEFSKYRGLFKYDFPLYYQNSVNKFAKQYDVPQEIIYTIMHDITEFNHFHISNDSKFGIMNIPYNENSSYSFFELFDVDRNIEEGAKILYEYLTKYEGNGFKALIAYTYGESYLSKIYFDYTNDINLASIIEPEERFFLQNLFMTYIFYSKLYQFR